MAYAGACDICSGHWLTYASDSRGVTIGESEEFMAEVRRCRYCGAYWDIGVFSYPKVISRDEARQELPNLDGLEENLGIDFPEPPSLAHG